MPSTRSFGRARSQHIGEPIGPHASRHGNELSSVVQPPLELVQLPNPE